MSNEEKAKLIADQCKPCSKDFYLGIKQGVLLTLDAEYKQDKVQKLIDYKNKLIDESKLAYDYASIEMDSINERSYLTESNVKEKIAKEIESIIYDPFNK